MAIALPRYLNYGNPIDRSNPLMRGLFSRWKVVPYYSSGGRFIDLAGKNHGTLNGALWAGDSLSMASPAFVSETGAYPHTGATKTTYNLASFTQSCWVKLNSVSSTNHWFIETPTNSEGNPRTYMWWTSKNQYSLGTNVLVIGFWTGAAFRDVALSWAPSASRWYHLTYTYDGTTCTGYVDGISIGSSAPAGTPTNAYNTQILIGQQGGRSAVPYNLDGYINDVCIFDRALSASEVSALYNATRQRYDPTLNWYSHPVMMGAEAAPPSGNPWNYYAQL